MPAPEPVVQQAIPESIHPIPEQYCKGQWLPTHYTTEEGGDWNPIAPGVVVVKSYSSLRYANGWVYDNVLRDKGLHPWRRDGGEI
jgi:hypothetical protein